MFATEVIGLGRNWPWPNLTILFLFLQSLISTQVPADTQKAVLLEEKATWTIDEEGDRSRGRESERNGDKWVTMGGEEVSIAGHHDVPSGWLKAAYIRDIQVSGVSQGLGGRCKAAKTFCLGPSPKPGFPSVMSGMTHPAVSVHTPCSLRPFFS